MTSEMNFELQFTVLRKTATWKYTYQPAHRLEMRYDDHKKEVKKK